MCEGKHRNWCGGSQSKGSDNHDGIHGGDEHGGLLDGYKDWWCPGQLLVPGWVPAWSQLIAL